MELQEAIAFGQYSGHESPQRILADRVIDLERENARLRNILNAARCVNHWHDGRNGGMVVSGKAIHDLWEAISYFDSLPNGRDEPRA